VEAVTSGQRVAFGRQVCGSLDEAASREWLVTDGLGGYACGTVAGLRTRRYHGLLVAATSPAGAARRLGLAALDTVVVIGDQRIRLATHEWVGGAIDPRGHERCASFDLDDGVPRWRYDLGAVQLEVEVAMGHGECTVGVVHRLLAGEARLEVTPLCTWRDQHGDRFAAADPAVETTGSGLVFESAYRVQGAGYEPGGAWYRGVHHREEAARGLGADEDLWAAGVFRASLRAGDVLGVVATTELGAPPREAVTVVAGARARAELLVARADAKGDDIGGILAVAADRFVVTTPNGPTAVAGYPWFGEWSRDLFTSYEGLFLCTGRADEGRGVLTRAAGSVSEGMLANTADVGTLEYNTIDATLWFVHALDRHVDVTSDLDLAAELAGTVVDILTFHRSGTRFGIGVDPATGLLRGGADGWALTWMDARVDGRPVTPRAGSPVEIQALWINALGAAADLLGRVGHGATEWVALRRHALSSFGTAFPLGPAGLADVVDEAGVAGNQPRPNQLLAASLPHGPVQDPQQVADIVRACEEDLVTSLGLRSLSPRDPGYRGRHRGGPAERDLAYHQGTVWPWLIGPYVDAARRAGRDTSRLLDGLELHLSEDGLASVSETTDGDPPHAATGCPFQAWSVAELIRARAAQHAVPPASHRATATNPASSG
jgi:predicted glycogen debranching enzyme